MNCSVNPFSMTFGKLPMEYIDRPVQREELVSELISDNPVAQAFMITGVRGSGKTVFLTEISKELAERDEWIVIPLNPDRDMLTALAGKLYNESELTHKFFEREFGIFLAGVVNASLNQVAITDIESTLEKMLAILKKHDKKLLITVDEAISSKYMREFVGAFQIFVREDYNIFLVMTGLYDNIKNLKDQKTLTFLYRAPQICLNSLNILAVKNSYKKVFDIDKDEAFRLAKLTLGYPFGYQALGYLMWKYKDISEDDLLENYDRYLAEFVYEKIWEELSGKDRKVITMIAYHENISISEILEKTGMKRNEYTVYRDRLIKKGMIVPSVRGKVELTLPRFGSFIEKYGKEECFLSN